MTPATTDRPPDAALDAYLDEHGHLPPDAYTHTPEDDEGHRTDDAG